MLRGAARRGTRRAPRKGSPRGFPTLKQKVKVILGEMVLKRLRDDPGLGEYKQNLLENAKVCEVYTHIGLGWDTHVKNDITWFPFGTGL